MMFKTVQASNLCSDVYYLPILKVSKRKKKLYTCPSEKFSIHNFLYEIFILIIDILLIDNFLHIS